MYPILPKLFTLTTKEARNVYDEITRWGSTLINQLDARDNEIDSRPSTNIRVVVTISSVNRPQKGDIVYSASAGKYKGYVSTAASTTWKNFN
jgi:hypothetical protein|tara:strand:- start:3805 stop:4080 length:276 start_codon:yes stop_codon:yes gene_type:complete